MYNQLLNWFKKIIDRLTITESLQKNDWIPNDYWADLWNLPMLLGIFDWLLKTTLCHLEKGLLYKQHPV